MKRILFCLISLWLAVPSAFAIEAGEVKLPLTLKAGDTELLLNGQGIRTKKIGYLTFNIYVGGLYLKNKSASARDIIPADEPMAIKLFITSNLISSKVMINTTKNGFERVTMGNIDPIRSEIDKMLQIFSKDINAGDIYDLVYIPESGTEIFKNGQKSVTIPGIVFKKALFGLWLSENCGLESLKRGMLGL